MAFKQMAVIAVVVAATVLVCINTAAAGPPDVDEQAKAAVGALIEKFNACWNREDGPKLVGEVLSDKAFVLVRPDKQPGEAAQARVQNKQQYIEAFKTYVLNANLRKHEHRIKSITVTGPIAYEFGIITDVDAGGGERRGEVLNVFAKEDVGWRLVFSTSPEFFEKRGRDSAADEKAVRKLARRFVTTFRSRRPTPFEDFEEMLAEDVVVVLSTGDTRVGKKTVVEFYREHLAEVRETVVGAKLAWEGMTAKIMGDGALVFGKLVIDANEKDGGKPMHREIWLTLVFRMDAGDWRLVEEHSTPARSEPSSKD
jgi:uncharacterized protein (TIGR02246 family)